MLAMSGELDAAIDRYTQVSWLAQDAAGVTSMAVDQESLTYGNMHSRLGGG